MIMRKNVFTIAMIVVALCVSMSCFAQAGKVNNFRGLRLRAYPHRRGAVLG